MDTLKLPTQEYIKSILSYDPITGLFHWKHRYDVPKEWNSRWAGKPAGKTTKRSYIMINNIRYQTSRLAWLYVYGEPVPERIDHEDTNETNNAIKNLRKATHSQNMANTGLWKNNKSGVKGVYWIARINKWWAYIDYNGRVSLGYFNTIEEAKVARQAAEIKYYDKFVKHD